MSIKALQDYTFYSKYAKHIPELKRRETWKETIERVFAMHESRYSEQLSQSDELRELVQFAKQAVMHKKVLGSQRVLQFGGSPILSKNERLYNCVSTHINRPRVFQECMFLLLCGCGAGFSVQKHHIEQLPKVQARTKGTKKYVVVDSIEGWADAIGVLMSSYFVSDQPFPEYAGYVIEFDLSGIRAKGTPISWGGRAPGSQGLENSILLSSKVIDRAIGSATDPVAIRSIDYYDIIMHCSDAVISGGIRRSATICLFSKDDEDMMAAKTGDWFITNPQRGRSNNSALLVRDETSPEEFANLMSKVKDFGEPGFVWADNREVAYNPCVEISFAPFLPETGESGWSFCNLTECNMKKCTTEQEYLDACKAASILGTLQAGYTDFPYLGRVTEEIVRREALLGVSMTGMMDTPDIAFDDKMQRKGAKEVLKWNEKVANLIGINLSARTNCVKPSGSASCVLGTASGIHPHHANRYFRRVQANKLEFPVQHFMKTNPSAVEDSVWSANNTDYVITFLCEVPSGAKTKNQLSAIELLEHVKLTQNNWVEYGTRPELSILPCLRHNVSNTITVRPDEWSEVEKYIYRNRKYFAGISLLPISGDKDYDQAPFTAVHTPTELVKMYGNASVFASGLIVDCVHSFESLWKGCDALLGIGEALDIERLKERVQAAYTYQRDSNVYAELGITLDASDEELEAHLADTVKNHSGKVDWMRRANQFAQRYFDGDVKHVTHCLKDVNAWKIWVDLEREYQDIDWTDLVEESYLIDADSISAQGCSGGKCSLSLDI